MTNDYIKQYENNNRKRELHAYLDTLGALRVGGYKADQEIQEALKELRNLEGFKGELPAHQEKINELERQLGVYKEAISYFAINRNEQLMVDHPRDIEELKQVLMHMFERRENKNQENYSGQELKSRLVKWIGNQSYEMEEIQAMDGPELFNHMVQTGHDELARELKEYLQMNRKDTDPFVDDFMYDEIEDLLEEDPT